MNGRVFSGNRDRLRSPQRLALLDVERVTDLCLEGLGVQTALDVGMGTGIFAESFVGRGVRVAGLDTNPDMIEAARGFVPSGDFQQASAENLPYSDTSFDLVFLGHVLHETEDPLQALQEAQRVARRRVAILEWPYEQEEKGPPLVHRFKTDRVIALAREAGFVAISTTFLSHMILFRLDLVQPGVT